MPLHGLAEIESARRAKLSAKSEWYFAFSVLVTLIWLYIEILRMLRRFKRRALQSAEGDRLPQADDDSGADQCECS